MERNLTFIALFAALIAVLGLLPKLTLGFGVPITAQSLGVMLAGTVLGAKRGFLAALLFVGLAIVGLPILAGGRNGLEAIQSPSVGFFLGFPIAAFVTGLVVERAKDMNIMIVGVIGSIIGGVVVLYILGVLGLAWKLEKTFAEALLLVTAFIPGDAVKALLAGIATQAIYKARPNAVMSRT
ncbi:BioY family transporter [Amylibacter kogurei]|uniref:Biotin transporter n=1 Tax=Paramylibacter kogurei TaxID=1889778 RepID=A0A2G5K8S6_9RHOB|nr:biotin transporter BioY [Amylibacter kogurei]PIB25936.1 BioY family transporter [Amylibacter kogurei]